MNSSDKDFALRSSPHGRPDDMHINNSSTTLSNDSVPNRSPDSQSRPVRINRDDVQKNAPPESDPDDPVAP